MSKLLESIGYFVTYVIILFAISALWVLALANTFGFEWSPWPALLITLSALLFNLISTGNVRGE